MSPRAVLLAPLLALSLSACALMDADDCARADWRRLGEQDAAQGYTADRLDRRAEACREHGRDADRAAYATGHRQGQQAYCSARRGEQDALAGRSAAALCLAPPQADYEQGFDRGLQAFCQPRAAYEHGRAGRSDPQTCPEAWRLDFETGHRLGAEVHQLGQRRQRLLADAATQRRWAADDKLKPEDRELARRRAVELEHEAARLRDQQRRAEIQALSLPR